VIHDYANSWKFLKEYDEGDLKLKKSKNKEKKRFEYEFIINSINILKADLIKKKEASDLFGSERDGSFQGILKTIYQTFGGKELYSSLDEKAAHLLYFIIKDHPFSDGNKRIGSFLFIYFLKLNGILVRANGENKINDNTLVALALLIAESDPKEKEMMVALTTNLLS
jgi:death-on-curing family protein